MSQTSGGRLDDLPEYSFIKITNSAAEAFGDDITDDSYSVSELSQYSDEKTKNKSKNKNKNQHDTFVKTKFRRLKQEKSIQESEFSQDSTLESSTDQTYDPTGASRRDSDTAAFNMTSFSSFGLAKFQMKTLATYSCSPLPQPLLPKHDKADYLASLASWVTILRIMGDLPNLDGESSLLITGTKSPVTSRVKATFKSKYSKKDMEDAHKKYSELFKDPSGVDISSLPFLSSGGDSMLEKVQFVCAMGIYKPALRDELYCQLCKQLTINPSSNSIMRGWVLMYLFVASFAPSENFAHILTLFLRDGPPDLSGKVDRMLRRTCSVGTRAYPPSWLEFQAAKNSKPLLIPITFMNGCRMLFEVDCATTVAEVVRNIGERLGILDISGYSIYISIHTKISCLGHGQHRIMDAISECEQNSKQMGVKESSTVWRVYFRREYFSPWFIPGEDAVDTDLIYQQVKRGVRMGEYRLDQEDQLLTLAAKCYYVEHPDDMGYYHLMHFVASFIPHAQLERQSKEYFQEKIKKVFEDLKLGSEKPHVKTVKTEVVRLARDSFHILFSRYYDVAKVVGPNLHLTEVVVGVSNKGIYVVDSNDTVKVQLEFAEVVDIFKTKHHLTLGIANMDDFVFSTNHSDDFFHTVFSNLDELRKRSTTAIAKQDFTHLDGPTDNTILKGDLVELSQSLGDMGDHELVTVLCLRTNKPSDIPVKLLYVIPTVEKPSEALVERMTAQVCKNAVGLIKGDKQQHNNLQNYAKTFFRQTSENVMTKFLNKASIRKKEGAESLWSWSKEELKKPLLKRTCSKPDVRKMALHCYSSIQKYMRGAGSEAGSAANYDLCAQWILSPAQRNKYLRDEIYCQIMKQLTNNPDPASVNRGWTLLTLLTSLTPASTELIDHMLAFIQTSVHPLAKQCEANVKAKRRRGGDRLYPSHFLEHEMICAMKPHMTVQVFLPDQTNEVLEVSSHTKIFNIKKEVATRLHLLSFHEFSLFLTAQDKVYCLSDRAYYFDCLTYASNYWFREKRKSVTSSQPPQPPILVMLKKIWVNGQPGLNPVVDKTFHFPQELPNYLRGYHQMPVALVNRLAALVCIAQFGYSQKLVNQFRELMTQVVPRGYLDDKNVFDVEESILSEIQQRKSMTPDDAKKLFIQELSRLATYGSVFCEVKQYHVKFLPTNCLVAINYSGVHFIDAKTKGIIKTLTFDSVPNWAFDETSFTLIMNESSNSIRIYMETTVGHNMDDLLMSYVAWIMNLHMVKKSGYTSSTTGETIC